MNILLISYYFKPFPGVGAKRLTYWFENMPKYDINPTVITAIKQEKTTNNIIYIENKKTNTLLSKFIKDLGTDWYIHLKKYFSAISPAEFNYEAVIISGGPFMQFRIAKFLKKKFNTKIILDYRDPYSNNPAFNDNIIKIEIKKYFERSFNKHADKIITVNKYCKQLLTKTDKEIYIINNGYDERYISKSHLPPKSKHENNLIISHAGTFIEGRRNPTIFFDTLKQINQKEVNYHFYQFGADSSYFDDYKHLPFFHYKGLIPYNTLVEELNASGVCLVITEGKRFESTTKIFDYIGLNKNILIISTNTLKKGSIHEITQEYPNTFWAENNIISITKALEKIKPHVPISYNPYKYSRAKGLEQLIEILKK